MNETVQTCSRCVQPVTVRRGRVVGLDGSIECYVGGTAHLLAERGVARVLPRSA